MDSALGCIATAVGVRVSGACLSCVLFLEVHILYNF